MGQDRSGLAGASFARYRPWFYAAAAYNLIWGALPPVFGWTIVTNDLLWWPAFGLFLRDAARRGGGWQALLGGE